MDDGADIGRARAPAADVVVFSSATTLGLRRSDERLAATLRACGVSTVVVTPDLRRVGRLRRHQPSQDLVEAAAARISIERALRHLRPRAVILGCATAALFQKPSVLRRAAVRYDALPHENRPGARNLIQHRLAQRALSLAKVCVPYSVVTRGTEDRLGVIPKRVPLGAPIPTDLHPRKRQRDFLCYAGDPHKRGLRVVLEAWWTAAVPGTLRVVGISRDAACEFCGGTVSDRVQWLGVVQGPTFRELTRESFGYISAAVYEDYGIAALEALAGGALPVLLPGEGPYEALRFAERDFPTGVASDMSSTSLAAAIRRVSEIPEAEVSAVQALAANFLRPLDPERYLQTVRDILIPMLLA